jgi:hypothetical protein
MITLKVVLPEAEEPDLITFLENWDPKVQQDPRNDLVAAISTLQRGDLEAWIRGERVVPRREARTPLFTDTSSECGATPVSAV